MEKGSLMIKRLVCLMVLATPSVIFSMDEAKQGNKTQAMLLSLSKQIPPSPTPQAEQAFLDSIRTVRTAIRNNSINVETWKDLYPSLIAKTKTGITVIKAHSFLPDREEKLLCSLYSAQEHFKQLNKEVTRMTYQQAPQDAGWRRDHSAITQPGKNERATMSSNDVD